MSVLVFIEHKQGEPSAASRSALTAAFAVEAQWGEKGVYSLCAGAQAKEAAQRTLQFGCERAFYCDDAALAPYRAVPYAQLALHAVEKAGASVFLAAATSTGKDFAPRVAFGLGAAQASDIISVEADATVARPMYAGDIVGHLTLLTGKKVVTVRTASFEAANERGETQAEPEELSLQFDLAQAGEVIEFQQSGGTRPELTDAEVVVSGGRALKSKENFEAIIFPLADALGAAVGASRAAVDSEFAPNDWQVGQTGKIVAPKLYVAVGISGAIQHLAGMKDSGTIVAINNDEEAPIFECADYGLVADLYEAVPELVQLLSEGNE